MISLKKKIEEKKTLTFPGAYNPFVAKLIEAAGFDGIYISGAALSNSMGVPDDGTLGLSDFVYFAKAICKSVHVPVICDADTGFDDIEDTVRAYIDAGLSGMHIEDQVFPKRCGHLSGKEVVSMDEMVQKIETAVKVKNKLSPDFLIIARTDARGAANVDELKQMGEAITRGKAYLTAGADMIFPESLRNKNEFDHYRQNVTGWLLANMTEFGKTSFISDREFKKIGYNLVIFPVSTFRFCAGVTKNALDFLKAEGHQEKMVPSMMTRDAINQLLDYIPSGEKK